MPVRVGSSLLNWSRSGLVPIRRPNSSIPCGGGRRNGRENRETRPVQCGSCKTQMFQRCCLHLQKETQQHLPTQRSIGLLSSFFSCQKRHLLNWHMSSTPLDIHVSLSLLFLLSFASSKSLPRWSRALASMVGGHGPLDGRHGPLDGKLGKRLHRRKESHHNHWRSFCLFYQLFVFRKREKEKELNDSASLLCVEIKVTELVASPHRGLCPVPGEEAGIPCGLT